ncbi:hypothetical protein IAT38_000030 [Cryptococcus sp. DSM 104549]
MSATDASTASTLVKSQLNEITSKSLIWDKNNRSCRPQGPVSLSMRSDPASLAKKADPSFIEAMTDNMFTRVAMRNAYESHLGMDLQPSTSPGKKGMLDSTVYLSTALVPSGTELETWLKHTADKATREALIKLVTGPTVGQFSPLTGQSLMGTLYLDALMEKRRSPSMNAEGKDEAYSAWLDVATNAGWEKTEKGPFDKLNVTPQEGKLAPSTVCPTIGTAYPTRISITPETMASMVDEADAQIARSASELKNREAMYPECIGSTSEHWNPARTEELNAAMAAKQASDIATYKTMAMTDIGETLAAAEAEGKDVSSADIISSFNYPRWKPDLETCRSIRQAPGSDVPLGQRMVNPESIKWQLVQPAPDAQPLWPPASVLEEHFA